MKRSFVLLVFCFLLYGSFAQDLIYTISGEYSDRLIRLDSILIENLTNETQILFDNLPEQEFYQVNLSEKSCCGTVSAQNIVNQSMFVAVHNSPGKLVLSNFNGTNKKIKCSVYSANGQLVYFSGFKNVVQGNSIQINLSASNFYVVRLESEQIVQTFKTYGANNVKQTEVLIIDKNSLDKTFNKKLLKSVYNFRFSIGDSLRVTAFNEDYSSTPVKLKIVDSKHIVFLFVERSLDYFGKTYKTVKINEKVWMAENMAFDFGKDCWAYNNDENHVEKYGRLYSWETAQKVCPKYWHLPSDDEWLDLAKYISDENGGYPLVTDDWFGVGKHLKDSLGWYEERNGTNDYGFSGLPGGFRTIDGEFGALGINGYWWSSTENLSTHAWYWYLYSIDNYFHRYFYVKESAISVRCVKN